MNPIDAISLAAPSLAPVSSAALAGQGPRDVSLQQAGQFRQALVADVTTELASPAVLPTLPNLNIEQVMLGHLPRADASPAEFALGMLRAQVKVAETAIAIEMVNKTTQSLSQGVQSLATRS